jgi:hypothetical protein
MSSRRYNPRRIGSAGMVTPTPARCEHQQGRRRQNKEESCPSLLPSTESHLLAPPHNPPSPRPGSPTAKSLPPPPSSFCLLSPVSCLLSSPSPFRPLPDAHPVATRNRTPSTFYCWRQCAIMVHRSLAGISREGASQSAKMRHQRPPEHRSETARLGVGQCHTRWKPRTEPMIAKPCKYKKMRRRREVCLVRGPRHSATHGSIRIRGRTAGPAGPFPGKEVTLGRRRYSQDR